MFKVYNLACSIQFVFIFTSSDTYPSLSYHQQTLRMKVYHCCLNRIVEKDQVLARSFHSSSAPYVPGSREKSFSTRPDCQLAIDEFSANTGKRQVIKWWDICCFREFDWYLGDKIGACSITCKVISQLSWSCARTILSHLSVSCARRPQINLKHTGALKIA